MEPLWYIAFVIPCSIMSASSLINLFLLFFYITSISFFAWKNHHQNPNSKGPSFSRHFLGFLPQMGPLAHRKLASMASSLRATRAMPITLGSVRVVVSSHPETAREILCGGAFSDRPIKDSTRVLMFDRAIGFAPSGEYWRRLRRIASTHMFSPRRVSSLEDSRQAVASMMIERVGREMREKGLVGMREILKEASLDNVLENVFGISGLGIGGKREELGVMVREGCDLMGEFNLGDYFPLGFLDFFGVERRCHKLSGKVRKVVSEIIRERKEGGADFKIRNDFLSVLLSLPHEDQLTDADMVAVLWEMVFRGVDNIAILLEWIMGRMVLHQDIQAKVQHEIHTQVGPNRAVRDSDIENLPYLQAVVKEVLRLHPPGPLLSWARLATHDVYLDECFIPAGTTAMVNMWAIAHDPSIWAEPWAFRPERFMGGDNFSIMGSDLKLAPFGSGRRACPGRTLALATVHLWLARILQHFKWLPGGPVDLGECLKLALEMKKSLVCFAVAR